MQLVELQRNVQARRGDEVAVYAISYDPVDVLAEFADRHGVTYPLLADVGSKTIIELGLLNHQIEEERAYWGREMTERHRGLPFPGTFVLDERGVVVEKIFERSHRIRPGGALLLDRLGVDVDDHPQVVTTEGPGLAVAAWVDTPEYFPNQLLRLTLRLAVEDGYHLYVPPNPAGFTDLTVVVDAPAGVFVHPVELPDGAPFWVEGFDETFNVIGGAFELGVLFYVLEDIGEVKLPVRIDYQACSATECLIPDSVELVLELREIRV